MAVLEKEAHGDLEGDEREENEACGVLRLDRGDAPAKRVGSTSRKRLGSACSNAIGSCLATAALMASVW